MSSSIVWKFFERPKVTSDTLKCPKCSTELVYKGTTSGLLRHLKGRHMEDFEKYKGEQSAWKKGPSNESKKANEPQDHLTLAFCTGRIPFDFVDNPEFVRFCKSINQKFKTPSSKNIREIVKRMNMAHLETTKTKLEGIKNYVLITDFNCERSASFYSVYAAYVEPTTFQRQFMFCDIRYYSIPETANDQFWKPTDFLNSFYSQCDKVTAVINDENFGEAFGSMPRILCSGSSINGIFNKFADKFEDVRDVFQEVKEVFEILNGNEEDLEYAKRRFNDLSQKADYTLAPLPVFPLPKWGLLFTLLQSYASNASLLSSIASLRDKMINGAKLTKIPNIVALLDPLNRALEELTDDSSFISDIVPNLLSVKEEIENGMQDEMSRELSALIQEEISSFLSNDHILLAMLSDPRYAFIPNMIDPRTWNEAEQLLSEQEVNGELKVFESVSHEQTGVGGLLKRKLNNSDTKRTLKTELLQYQALMSTHRPFHTSDPLQFWKEQVFNFPKLATLSVKFLTATASTSSCEKMYQKCFTKAKRKREIDDDLYLFGHALAQDNETEQGSSSPTQYDHHYSVQSVEMEDIKPTVSSLLAPEPDLKRVKKEDPERF
uniref:BED-type domain-containing protein n=1 Tax=Caenorhabditis tropicalis TaxID=1561998 RepID=A0A1I7UAL9_9PELO